MLHGNHSRKSERENKKAIESDIAFFFQFTYNCELKFSRKQLFLQM